MVKLVIKAQLNKHGNENRINSNQKKKMFYESWHIFIYLKHTNEN